MKLQSYKVIETPRGRFVAVDFEPDEHDRSLAYELHPAIKIQTPISGDGRPRTTECLLEALRRTQAILGEEIDRVASLYAASEPRE